AVALAALRRLRVRDPPQLDDDVREPAAAVGPEQELLAGAAVDPDARRVGAGAREQVAGGEVVEEEDAAGGRERADVGVQPRQEGLLTAVRQQARERAALDAGVQGRDRTVAVDR